MIRLILFHAAVWLSLIWFPDETYKVTLIGNSFLVQNHIIPGGVYGR